MSFILEALRKSEAERRRGQSPDLLAQPLPVPQHARKPLPTAGGLLVVLAFSLVVVALLVWRWPQPASTTPDATAIGTSTPSVDTSAGVTAPAPSITGSPDALDTPSVAPSMLEGSPAVAEHSASVHSMPLSAAQRELAGPPVTQSTPVPAQHAAPLTQEPPHATAETAGPTPSVAARAPATASVEPAQDVAAATPARAQGRSHDDDGAARTASVATTSFASPDLPLRLSDLSAEERQQLPALKVSMHLWAPENERRFAIIDGSRVAEGDRVGEATVESIQADAVLLAWRGRRIRLAIR